MSTQVVKHEPQAVALAQVSAKLLRFDCNGQAKADERLNAL